MTVRAVNDTGGPSTHDDRPMIMHEAGDLPTVIEETLDAVRALGLLYVWGGRLVRIHRTDGKQSGAIHRPEGSPQIHMVDAAHVAELATRAAIHRRYDARSNDWKVIDCPRRIAEGILARGHWPRVPRLNGVTESPTLAPDFRLLRAGYDSQSGIFVADEPSAWRPPADKPSREEALEAAEILRDAVGSFPFVTDSDEAGLISMIITAVIRRSIPSAPIYAVTAPTPGTGKSYSVDLASVIAQGRRPAVLSLGRDPSEAEKRLAAALLAGDPLIALDNVERPLDGDLLCQVATQPTVRLRPLGGSSMLSIPTQALIAATGNNLAVIGDLRRRTVLIRLDAGVERPERRRFPRDLLAWAADNRGELLRAALTLPMAYRAAGEPAIDDLQAYAGFSEWDRMVRRPLCWLGLPDPLGPAERLRDDDPDLESARNLLTNIRAAFGEHGVTVAEIIRSAQEFDGTGRHAYPDLHDAVEVVCAERISGRRLGGWLRRHRDRIVDGLQLLRIEGDSHQKVARWLVRSA